MWSNVVMSYNLICCRLCALQGVRGAIFTVCMEEDVCGLTVVVMDDVIVRIALTSWTAIPRRQVPISQHISRQR